MPLSQQLFSSFQSYFIKVFSACRLLFFIFVHVPMRSLALKSSIFGWLGFSVLLGENVPLVW